MLIHHAKFTVTLNILWKIMKGILQWKSKHDSTKLYMIDTCTCKLSWLHYQAIYCTSQITLQCQAFEHKLINVLHQVPDRIQEKLEKNWHKDQTTAENSSNESIFEVLITTCRKLTAELPFIKKLLLFVIALCNSI